MKNLKKIASLMLALVIVMAMSVTAFAATGDFTTTKGSITIQNTIKDTNYSIYRIFDLESFSDDGTNVAYSYKVNRDWDGFFTALAEGVEPTNGRKYVDIDENGYVTWKTGADQAAFANDALAYAEATTSITAKTKKATANNTDVVFNELDLGYYLVDSSAGAICALDTTNPNAIVIEKNTNPTLKKKVWEDDWADRNDANVGDTVKFQATITVYGTAKDYVMHDLMDGGLTFGTVTGVTLNGTAVANEGNVNYEVITSTTDGDTFDVTFKDTFCAGLKSGDVIVVSYEATLDTDAVVSQPENNKANLEYKDYTDTVQHTEDSTTQTYTWEIPVLKYANGDKTKLLAGAVFELYKTEETAADGTKTYSDLVKFDGLGENKYRHNAVDGPNTSITTDGSGRFRLQGLDAGTYYLKEKTAPTGYNRLNTVVTITIDHNGYLNFVDANNNGTIDEGEKHETEIGVNNQAGTELPSTGGIGTVIFYIVGGILLVGAGVVLVVRKRMNAEAKNK